jgi:hypothetical protein
VARDEVMVDRAVLDQQVADAVQQRDVRPRLELQVQVGTGGDRERAAKARSRSASDDADRASQQASASLASTSLKRSTTSCIAASHDARTSCPDRLRINGCVARLGWRLA